MLYLVQHVLLYPLFKHLLDFTSDIIFFTDCTDLYTLGVYRSVTN